MDQSVTANLHRNCNQHNCKLSSATLVGIFTKKNQILFVVVGPGPEPTMHYSKLTMVESAYEVKFYKVTLVMWIGQVPIVMGHNSTN